MKILVTGGAGFIGAHAIRRLSRLGHEVTALVRDEASVARIAEPGIEAIPLDLAQADFSRLEGRSFDTVVHSAALLGKFGIGEDRLRKVNVEATINLFNLCSRLQVRHFIHLSTIGVLGAFPGTFPDHGMAGLPACGMPGLPDEDAPCAPENPYERTKHDAERKLWELAEKSGIRLTIGRMGYTYGPGDRHRLPLFRSIGNGWCALIGGGNACLQPVFVEDAVDGIEKMVNRGGSGNEIYHLAGGAVVSWKNYIGLIAEALGCRPPFLSIPTPLARLAAAGAETLAAISGMNFPVTRSRVYYLTHSYAANIEKARRDLQYQPETGLREGIAQTIAWYRKESLI